MSEKFDPVVAYCENFLGFELEDWEKQWLDEMVGRRIEPKPSEVVHNAFEDAAVREPEWKHIPGYAEFEVNREGEVRNVLTKLPLKAFGTATRKEAFMLRADNGVKRMIYADWIVQQTFPN